MTKNGIRLVVLHPTTADSESTVQFWILDFDVRFRASSRGDQASSTPQGLYSLTCEPASC